MILKIPVYFQLTFEGEPETKDHEVLKEELTRVTYDRLDNYLDKWDLIGGNLFKGTSRDKVTAHLKTSSEVLEILRTKS